MCYHKHISWQYIYIYTHDCIYFLDQKAPRPLTKAGLLFRSARRRTVIHDVLKELDIGYWRDDAWIETLW